MLGNLSETELYDIQRKEVIWKINMTAQLLSDNIPIEVTTSKKPPFCDNVPTEDMMDKKHPFPDSTHKEQQNITSPMKIWDVNWGANTTTEFV